MKPPAEETAQNQQSVQQNSKTPGQSGPLYFWFFISGFAITHELERYLRHVNFGTGIDVHYAIAYMLGCGLMYALLSYLSRLTWFQKLNQNPRLIKGNDILLLLLLACGVGYLLFTWFTRTPSSSIPH